MMKCDIKFFFLFLPAIILVSCGTDASNNNASTFLGVNDTPEIAQETGIPDTAENLFVEYATFFILIADTGKEYFPLLKEMNELSNSFQISIDSMGRHYDAKKDLIALADDDEDELYAGDYFPRRFPSDHLSLEYLDVYQKNAGEKTIALIAGIFENRKQADSLLKIISPVAVNAYVSKSEIYTGCMH